MKQVVLHRGRAEVVDVSPPRAAAGGVLVQVAYSVISSGTERANLMSSGESALDKAWRKPALLVQAMQSMIRDGIGPTIDRVQRKLDAEVPSGYSCAGSVVEVGDGAEGFTVGQAVACAGGRYANHAEFVAVPKNLVCPVPQGVPLADAASVAIGAIALQGIRRASLEIGDRVVVMGLGLLGLLTVQMAKAAGATVIAVDPVAARRDLARNLGAVRACAPDDLTEIVASVTDSLGADRTLLTAATANSEPLALAMNVTRKRGRVVVVGDVGLEVERSPFYEKEIELTISCSYGPGRYDTSYEEGGLDYPPAYVRWTENRNMQSYLELLRSGAVDWPALGGLKMRLGQAEDAFLALQSPEPPLVVTLEYEPLPLPVKRGLERSATSPTGKQGRIRLGIIGAGEFTRSVHLPILKRMADRFAVVGVATRTGLSARTAAREAGASLETTDYRELLTRPDIDAVLIATRHDQHSALSIAALESGKAVFVEKPIATDQDQLNSLLAAVERAGLPFMAGFNRRFSPAGELLRNRIRAHIKPAMVLYRVNAGAIGTSDWTVGPEGGGRAVGEACHMVDFLHSLSDGALERIQVAGSSDDNFSVQLTFSDDLEATLIYTTHGATGLGKERVEAFLGGEVVVIDDFRQGLTIHQDVFASRKTKVSKGHREEWEVFHRTCTTGSPMPISLDHLRSVAEVTFRIRTETGR